MTRRRLLMPLLTLSLLAARLPATWSIILVDTRTGEIAVGSATCLTGYDLEAITPVLLVGRGAATAQAAVNLGSITNRALIWNMLMQGATPQAILAALAFQDPQHQTRQYGIVDVTGGKVTFSGSLNSAWAGGVIGSTGTIHYAIQGNILTGQAVVAAAEQAVLATPGDLAGRLMAAMEAARMMGGDGRCSCSPTAPTSCGAPPPSFTKSAHIGFMIAARQGDLDGACNNAFVGCASGTYYMNLNVALQAAGAPDPVLQLQGLFSAWRASITGRPDHHLSTVTLDPPTLLPDGASQTTATIVLRDWQGISLNTGGATVTVVQDPASSAPVIIGSVTDHGDGSYSFPVTAGTIAGTALLRATVDDGQGPVLLSPRTEIPVQPAALWADTSTLSAQAGGVVGFQLDAGSGAALRPYAVAASVSGSVPGIPVVAGVTIPLNPDPVFFASIAFANTAFLPNSIGQLDANGRGMATLVAPSSSFLFPLAGAGVTFAFATLVPTDFASNPVTLTVGP